MHPFYQQTSSIHYLQENWWIEITCLKSHKLIGQWSQEYINIYSKKIIIIQFNQKSNISHIIYINCHSPILSVYLNAQLIKHHFVVHIFMTSFINSNIYKEPHLYQVDRIYIFIVHPTKTNWKLYKVHLSIFLGIGPRRRNYVCTYTFIM